MTTDDQAPVIFEELNSAGGKKIATATLNAPKSINSLNMTMAEMLYHQLLDWQEDDSIACVLLRGSGDKGFCAGGDVLQLHDSAVKKDNRAQLFFTQEYRLDYLIHTYAKPIVVWGHGIVMGGGLGLMAGASHRVVTEKTRLAMPEVTIGLYPDVGGSWFLNRMPGKVGLFLALTGASINAADTQFVGLADYFLNHSQWDELLSKLQAANWQGNSASVVSAQLIALASQAADKPESPVHQHFEIIGELCTAASNDAVVANIVNYSGDDEWLKRAAGTLANGCPTTIKLVFEQLQASKHLSLKEVFQMELVLSCNCMKLDNFAEGVRALLIDKDKSPKFTPAKLAEVTDTFIAQHFVAPWSGEHPLADL
ncbi:enoyl-CoA hydratase/isomerase family protein [Halioxenophilus sp. WMMB6]|uniref:enoyl-CoA hydratase/isomerase family protein n=1 Tax=Halioxenophilus sp. WMMB6 TaxID=3073815 RepID=UPI00295E581F|nr:enoyl-CoA hydratase/isomerase family protein [Halioxenophilus sp. WMMB6]